MLIKAADDKSKRLALLEDLQRSPLLDRRQKDWLRDELHRTRRGLAGEREAAHYLDNYLKDDPERALLHDLRFRVDGAVIQIDHLVITRGLYVYLLETKNFNGNLHINAFGEFSVAYPGERMFGIPSPLEQSRRHEGPLQKLFALLDIKGRNGAAPRIHHCVLVHPKSIIHRPPVAQFDTRDVIKADQFRSWHERFQDRNIDLSTVVSSLMNLRSADTLREFAEKLARQHRPADPLALPDFMRPRQPSAPQTQAIRGAAAPAPAPSFRTAPATEPVTAREPAPAGPGNTAAPPDPDPALRRKLVCVTCGSRISFAEGKFCWNNEARFGGWQYCRMHQAAFR